MIHPKLSKWILEYENPYHKVFKVTADFGNLQKEYFVTESGERAGILAFRDDQLLLVRQYRLLINGFSWELPGGKVEPGESPANAAVRECLEETGIRCLSPQKLLFYHAGLDTRHNPTHIFASDTVAIHEEVEEMHGAETSGHKWVPLDSAIDMVLSGIIKDSFTISGILAYYVKYMRRSVGP